MDEVAIIFEEAIKLKIRPPSSKLSVKSLIDNNTQDIETLKEQVKIRPTNGKDGTDGKDGRDGIDGKDGINGINGKDGKDGKNGTNGIDGKDGINGIDGKDGINGTDGIGIKDTKIVLGDLMVTFTTGETKNLGRVVGYNGVNGQSAYEQAKLGGYTDTEKEFNQLLANIYIPQSDIYIQQTQPDNNKPYLRVS